MGRREDQRKQQQTTKWYVHAYLHADDPTVLPLGEAALDGVYRKNRRNATAFRPWIRAVSK